ncbi:bcl-2 homologous antagonist/killer isoform X1 [Hyla sarda]|uniref:bcl-2 homologous antagonist/killer isoform X1 n=1 Tax=Hyla sarda TaxID=327740 RepID=UPI0024C27586|nr:bcl-2 homologous antagonist/killer isoform X1 [Hyla sarda]XP_056413532.1 bcl-2 homologous antagonist/killer isoform X1 [Hyla sarda]XP_056413534.1 bcl-2 homologous antagonist/killer isoform X1 [Hyla sarda]
MATGGGEDTTDEAINKKEEQEAEAVFLSYTFHMTTMRSENEDSRPLRDEIDVRQRDSVIDNLGKQLATIGDDIYKQHEKTFDNFLRELNPNLDNAYDIFKKIASSVFETEVNWGRILTLLGFGYRMAVYIWRKGQHGFLKRIARCVARYLVESSIARWIARQGGWGTVLTLTNYGFRYALMALGVVLIMQFVMRRLSSPGQ